MLIGIGFAAADGAMSTGVVAETAQPAGPVLTVERALAGAKPQSFDLAALKSLPVTEVWTMTPWTEGEHRYEGVRLRDLLAQLGAEGHALVANAIDDYQVTIPMEDVRDYDVIIAYAVDGRTLPEDNKGPLWIVYPFSQHAGLRKNLYFSRCVWQLNRLTVK
jgi:hypothetical protein